MLSIISMQWYFAPPLSPTGGLVGLGNHANRVTTKEIVDLLSKELVHTACRMDVVSPHRSVPPPDVPLFKTIPGRCFKDKIEKIRRGQDHRRDIFVLQ